MTQGSSAGLGAGALGAALTAVLLAWGCGHTEPFASPPYGSDAPFDPSPPQRLTYNLAADRYPSWLADGAGLLYSAQQLDREDNDVCLALLPPTGGSHRELWCDVPAGRDQVDAIESAVVGSGGRLGFVSATGSVGGANPARQDIAVASSLDPAGAQMVRRFPNTSYGIATQTSGEHLRWLDQFRLVYVDQAYHVRRLCSICVADTIRIGKAVVILDVGAAGAEPTPVPGTQFATGLAVTPEGGAILYTLADDSRVFRHSLENGAVEVVHDFAPAGVARDIHLAGSRLAAVVGGRVASAPEPGLGAVQWDSGGVLHVLDLESGADVILDTPNRVYRRPALSPAGDRLVAEGYPVTLVDDSVYVVGRSGDVFLFGAP